MKVLSLVMITMVLMAINVQSQSLLDTVTDLVSTLLGRNVEDVSKTVTDVAKSLQAETLCKCLSKAYEDGKVTACTTDDEFDTRQLVQDLFDVLPKCAKLPMPPIDKVLKSIPSGSSLIQLNIKAKERCQCSYGRYVQGRFEACLGTKILNPIDGLREFIKFSDCKNNGSETENL